MRNSNRANLNRRCPSARATTVPILAALLGSTLAVGASAQAQITHTSATSATSATSPTTPTTSPFEDVSVLVNGYEVFASLPVADDAPRPTIRASLESAGSLKLAATSSTAGPDGSAALAFISSGLAAPHRPVLMQPGERLLLEAIAPGAASPYGSTTLEIPMLTAELEPSTGRLAGHAPPGTSLGITARRTDGTPVAPQKTIARADGTWLLEMGALLNLEPGARGIVYFRDGKVTWQRAWAFGGLVAQIGGDSVTAYSVPGDVLKATVLGEGQPKAGTALATSETVAWDGTALLVLRDAAGNPYPLPGGTTLSVARRAGAPFMLATSATEATFDPLADTVTGQTQAGSQIVAELSEPSQSRSLRRDAIAGPDGTFALALLGEYDITAETRLILNWPATPGLSLTAYPPRVTSRDPLVSVITGQGTAGEVVMATMDSSKIGPVAGTARVDSNGRFRLALRPPGGAADAPPAWPGDSAVNVTLGGEPLTPLASPAPLRVEASASSDTVSSIGDAGNDGQQVTVTIGDESRTVAVASGSWQLETGDWADLQPGTEVSLRLVDTDGVETALDFPVLRVSAQAETDRVRVEGPPGLATDIEHNADGRDTVTSACVVVRTSCTVSLADKQGKPVVLQPGDTIAMYPAFGDSADLEVKKMTAHIDPGGNDVVGEGPPHEPVRVEFSNPEGVGIPQGGGLGTDAQGVYDFELRSSENGLMLPGLAADVFQLRPNRHQIWARGVLEQLRLAAASAEVRGLVEPMTKVVAWLNAAGANDPRAAIASGETTSDRDGSFAVTLNDSSGRPVPLGVGQTVGVSHARGVRLATAPPLFAWPRDPSAGGTIVGQTAAGLAAKALYTIAPGVLPTGAPETPGLAIVRGAADAGGFFELEPPAINPADILQREVVATLPGGDEIRLILPAEARASTVFLPSAGR